MNIHQKENFFFTHAITILSLFTYSVCDEKVKIDETITIKELFDAKGNKEKSMEIIAWNFNKDYQTSSFCFNLQQMCG